MTEKKKHSKTREKKRREEKEREKRESVQFVRLRLCLKQQ